MKTYILQLEPHDDIVSARDKMGWSKSARILVVWPERGRVLNRRLDILLLRRHASALGTQVALVTHDREVRRLAGQLAIPVFNSVRQAHNEPWRAARKARRMQRFGLGERPPGPAFGELERPARGKPLSPGTRLTIYSIAILAMLAAAAALAPAAEVRLAPQHKEQKVVIAVKAGPEFETVSLSGAVPVEQRRVVVEGRDSIPTTGKVDLPLKPARGTVVFTNLTEDRVLIPKGTVAASMEDPQLRFAVTQGGSAPAGSGESVRLPVEALSPGKIGNVPAGTLDAVEGDLGLRLVIGQPDPMRGGEDFSSPAPSAADRRRLANRLIGDLRDTAQAELLAGMDPNDLLLDPALQLEETLESVYTPSGQDSPNEQTPAGPTQPAEDFPAQELGLNLRLAFSTPVAPGEALRQLAQAVLDAGMSKDFNPVEGTLEIRPLGAPQLGRDGVWRWKMEARRQLQAALGDAQAVQMIAGLPLEQAADRLAEALPVEGPPEIQIWPGWWPRLPLAPFRIQVRDR